jgi:hypothetical protein
MHEFIEQMNTYDPLNPPKKTPKRLTQNSDPIESTHDREKHFVVTRSDSE